MTTQAVKVAPGVGRLRRDGAAALEWLARYLERMRDLPVRARGRARATSARAAAVAARGGRAVRGGPPRCGRDPPPRHHPLEHTRASSPTSRSRRRSRRSSPSSSRPASTRSRSSGGRPRRRRSSSWSCSSGSRSCCAARGLARPHRGHGLDLDARRARGRPSSPGGQRSSAPSTRTRRWRRRAKLLDLDCRKIAVDAEFRLRADLLAEGSARGESPRRGDGRDDLQTAVDPVPEIADLCERHGPGCTWTPPTRARRGSVRSCAGRRRASSEPTPLVVNPHKWLFVPMDCSALWTSRPEVFRETFSLTPEYLRTDDDGREPVGLRPGSREPVPLAQALDGDPLLRPRGAAAADPRARAARAALRLVGRGRAGLGDLGAIPVLRRLLPAGGTDEENEALLERVNATGELFISHTRLNGRYVLRLAVGNARTTEADVRHAWDVLRAQAGRCGAGAGVSSRVHRLAARRRGAPPGSATALGPSPAAARGSAQQLLEGAPAGRGDLVRVDRREVGGVRSAASTWVVHGSARPSQVKTAVRSTR